MPAKNDTDLEPLLNTQQNQLGLVMDEAASVDGKALAILAVIVAVLIYIAQAGLHLTEWWHTALLLSPFCLALVFTILAIWPRHYIGATPDLDKEPENLKLDRDTLILQLLANTNYASKYNNRLNRKRWFYCVDAIALMFLGFIFLFAIV